MSDKPVKLIVLSDPARGKSFELTESFIRIGRSEEAEVSIVDGTISGIHCELLLQEDGNYLAKDLGSTNGSRINGDKFTEKTLVNSDILQVGEIEILYDREGATPTTVRSEAGTRVLDLEGTVNTVIPTGLGSLDPTKKSGKKKTPANKSKKIVFGAIGIFSIIVVVMVYQLIANG